MTDVVKKSRLKQRRTNLPKGPDGRPLPGPGRPAGVPNEFTKTVRAMILGALDELGGQAWLVEQGAKHPKAFFALLARLLPTEVRVPQGTNVVLLDWQALLSGKPQPGIEEAIDVTPTKADDAP